VTYRFNKRLKHWNIILIFNPPYSTFLFIYIQCYESNRNNVTLNHLDSNIQLKWGSYLIVSLKIAIDVHQYINKVKNK